MNVAIIDCGSKKSPDIAVMAASAGASYQTFTYPDFDAEMIDNFDALIISGAPILLTEVDQQPYREKFSFLSNRTRPTLGICFGHQMLGLSHGAKAIRCWSDRSWRTIDRKEESPLLKKLPKSFDMMQDHCEAITIPNGFKCTASSPICTIEAMEHESLPLYGVQFHPEVSGKNGQLLMDNFIRIARG